MFTLWNCYILKIFRLETITFSDATLSDIYCVMLCFVAIPVLYLEILVDVDIDHRDDDKRQQELDRARVHREPASIEKNFYYLVNLSTKFIFIEYGII